MPVELDIRGDVKQLTRHLNAVQRRVVPRVTVRALNETATKARQEATKAVAADVKLPATVIRKRFDAKGNLSGERVVLVRANKARLKATIEVSLRGILVSQARLTRGGNLVRVSGKQTSVGVKAAGGRLYKGAFYANVKGNQIVLKRFPNSRKTFAPRIGVRLKLLREFDQRLVSPAGIRLFRARFQRLLAFELQKLRARTP